MSHRLLVVPALLAALLLAASGCGTKSAVDGKTPTQAVQLAKSKFDHAQSVHLSLSTGSVPKDGNGVLAADGTLTHQPAFKGWVKVVLSGLTATVPVVSVDRQLHARLPLQTQFQVIDPAEYGAPDPATFADPQTGISSLIGDLRSLKKSGQTRQGDEVLTTYTGELPGRSVKTIIPSASTRANYRTSVGIDQSGYATKVMVTGPFFAGSDDVTYQVLLDHYGKGTKITAP